MEFIKPVHILKIGLGINMLVHGAIRLPKLSAFVAKTSGSFADSPLPTFMVTAFLYTLPFLETAVGLLLLFGGKFSRWGIIGGGAIICALIFGTAIREDWATVGQQTVYLMAFTLALYFYDRELNTVTP